MAKKHFSVSLITAQREFIRPKDLDHCTNKTWKEEPCLYPPQPPPDRSAQLYLFMLKSAKTMQKQTKVSLLELRIFLQNFNAKEKNIVFANNWPKKLVM